jgi:glycosyltransferase involved in cell wall biosynthesis
VSRILIVHQAIDDPDAVRGTTRCLLDLLAHIDRRRFEPIVWCNRPMLPRVAATGVVVEEARDWALTGARLSPSWMREAAALIRRHRIDLVHADEYMQAAALVPVARMYKLPLVVQLHRMSSKKERRWALVHQADVVVGTSEAAVAGLLEDGYPADRAVVIYNGVDPAELSRHDAAGLRPALGIGPREVVITLAAYFAPFKAIDVALRAFAGLRERHPDGHLLLCGDGPERPRLESQVDALGLRPFVHFLGHRQDVGAVLRDSTDILLSTSRNESFGLTLAEAGVFGIPVVASRVSAHCEVLGDGEAGVLVPLDDAAAFAEALGALAADARLRQQFGTALQRRVNAMFDIRQYVRGFEHLYSRMLAEPRAAHGWLRGTRWPRAYTEWVHERAHGLR